MDHDGRGVTAIFDDGTRASGDVVVGADGILSVGRDTIAPDAPRFPPGTMTALLSRVVETRTSRF